MKHLTGTRWLPILAVFVAVISLLGETNAQGDTRPALQTGSPHLYIMFLPGLCPRLGADRYCHGRVSAADRARATFGTLRSALSSARITYTPVYYSYNPAHADYYSVTDTRQSVARSASALEQELRQVWQRDPQATFDLVGHSLGGVVAVSWAVSDGREYGLDPARGLLPRVHSLVTFDSPVKGVQVGSLGAVVAQVFTGPVWYSLQPDSETIKEITFFPSSWWRSVGHLHTIANRSDLIVPPKESTLGDSRVVTDSNCSQDILFLRSCHGAVLADASLNRWVACPWLDPAQCRPPTPTPTPTETPTETATPTPVSTAPVVTITSVAPPPPTAQPNPRIARTQTLR